MDGVIQLLPDAVANQIAAGEVVQRPGSVVKELVENAIDAKATDIQVYIKDAGKTLICVADNGIGMTKSDIKKSILRHATSKLKVIEDLFKLRTMGFRGEALASIAAVAHLKIQSKTNEEELGYQITVADSKIEDEGPLACEAGTTIEVKHLFYNVPARRNFLKSNAVEMKHIIEVVQHTALAHPHINVKLVHNDSEIYFLPKANLAQRIVQLFGKSHQEQIAECHEITSHLSITGYIGKPSTAKKTKGEQFLFVNNRYVKSAYINHAVINAYEGLLQDGTRPFYALFIEIDPALIDVNVHPTKTEIKFEDEKTIYGTIQATVKQALGKYHFSPSLNFDYDVNFQAKQSGTLATPKTNNYTQFKSEKFTDTNLKHWESLFEKNEAPHQDEQQTLFEPTKNENKENTPLKYNSAPFFHHLEQYLLTKTDDCLFIIDKVHALERVLYEQFLKSLTAGHGVAQQLLFPINVNLQPASMIALDELKDELIALGITFEKFGQSSIVISGLPAELKDSQVEDFLDDLLAQFDQTKQKLKLPKVEQLARALAKRAAMNSSFEQEAISGLVDQLFKCKIPGYSPSGHITFVKMDAEKIGTLFNTTT